MPEFPFLLQPLQIHQQRKISNLKKQLILANIQADDMQRQLATMNVHVKSLQQELDAEKIIFQEQREAYENRIEDLQLKVQKTSADYRTYSTQKRHQICKLKKQIFDMSKQLEIMELELEPNDYARQIDLLENVIEYYQMQVENMEFGKEISNIMAHQQDQLKTQKLQSKAFMPVAKHLLTISKAPCRRLVSRPPTSLAMTLAVYCVNHSSTSTSGRPKPSKTNLASTFRNGN